jgi:ketosteroid isomerase-like protein
MTAKATVARGNHPRIYLTVRDLTKLAVAALPDRGYGHRVAQQDAERVRRIFETFSAEKLEELLQDYAPGFVYHPRSDEPDASVKANRDEFEQLARGWLEAFPQITFDVHELTEVGDCVIAVTTLHGRGSASGLEVHDDYVFVYRMRDGLALEGWEYKTKAEALAAIADHSTPRQA